MYRSWGTSLCKTGDRPAPGLPWSLQCPQLCNLQGNVGCKELFKWKLWPAAEARWGGHRNLGLRFFPPHSPPPSGRPRRPQVQPCSCSHHPRSSIDSPSRRGPGAAALRLGLKGGGGERIWVHRARLSGSYSSGYPSVV